MMKPVLSQQVEAMRRFNRFYTRQIGVLNEKLLSSTFSLSEARVMYELAHQPQTTATALCAELGLDAGYLSRLLRGFERRGLIEKQVSATDGRQSHLWLTPKGRDAFTELDVAARHEIEAILTRLPGEQQARLVVAMQTIEQLLGTHPEPKVTYLLRPPQPGDMGWIVQRHGAVYAQEYGFDAHFEALVAEIVAHFIEHYDPQRERGWIAEKDGENVGSVLLVKHSDEVAKLRVLLVEPQARGRGIGARLVNECMRFARQAGYTRITLWTGSTLAAARHIYARANFRVVGAEPQHSFGQEWTAETWELEL